MYIKCILTMFIHIHPNYPDLSPSKVHFLPITFYWNCWKYGINFGNIFVMKESDS